MIRWLQQEDGEGHFNSRFFRNDENKMSLLFMRIAITLTSWNVLKGVWTHLTTFLSV